LAINAPEENCSWADAETANHAHTAIPSKAVLKNEVRLEQDRGTSEEIRIITQCIGIIRKLTATGLAESFQKCRIRL
jgi:hypothetical protein